MSASKFKFVSPGIFLQEIDRSQIGREPTAVGPVIIGRTRRGPSLRPVRVDSFLEFSEIFGEPSPGLGSEGGDVSRDGGNLAPTYAAYAAQAWLRNNSPATIVRLAGAAHESAVTDSGEAGWRTKNRTGASATSSAGGAYGLYIWPSGTTEAVLDSAHVGTGTLAAVWYMNEGNILLSGVLCNLTSSTFDGNHHTASVGGLTKAINSSVTGGEWKVFIKGTGAGLSNLKTTTFNFNRSSANFIRKAFNTNPTLVNSNVTDDTKTYWLGESYEVAVNNLQALNATGSYVGAILGLKTGSIDVSDFRKSVAVARTGWFVSQDLNANTGSYQVEDMQKLFRFHGLPSGGEWEQNNLSISIEEINYSSNQDINPYGSFTVAIRNILKDNDKNPNVVERFVDCNLNPRSTNYIAKRIGDKEVTWSDLEQRFRELGQYDGKSKFIRIEMNSDVDGGGTGPTLLPFGFLGPPRWASGSVITNNNADHGDYSGRRVLVADAIDSPYNIRGGVSAATITDESQKERLVSDPIAPAVVAALGVVYPGLGDFLRHSASVGGLGSIKDAYFGVNTNHDRGAGTGFARAYRDLVKAKPKDMDSFDPTAGYTEYSFTFSLDDVVVKHNLRDAWWISGSRAGTKVVSDPPNGYSLSAKSSSYSATLDAGYDRFTAPLYGGFEGVDVRERDPFNNRVLLDGTVTTNYAYNSVKRAINTVASSEDFEMNTAVAPGVDNESLTQHLINVCEERADALAVIDLVGGYTPRSESSGDFNTRKGDVDAVITAVKARNINSSYAASYYPWVQVLDSLNDAVVWLPPSVAALGTFASTDSRSAVWFAPAGFTRGGLSEGAAGLSVINVDGKLTSKQRDKLYNESVNPIASFPAEGIVIFGQKTMQATRSALDRINVRRLLIFIKKEVSRVAATTLFENNILSTWNSFSGRVERFLQSIQVGGGLVDFKVVLDETTTTPDLIDRNVLYAKVFLKPARAIEFIAVDFIITRTGASFDD